MREKKTFAQRTRTRNTDATLGSDTRKKKQIFSKESVNRNRSNKLSMLLKSSRTATREQQATIYYDRLRCEE